VAPHSSNASDGICVFGARAVRPTLAQLAALAELLQDSPLVLDGLDVRIAAYPDASLRGILSVTLRDRWSSEHYRIDRAGLVTRPELT
jgi:hypothetical protein